MKRILSTIALVLFVGMGFAQDKAVKAEKVKRKKKKPKMKLTA